MRVNPGFILFFLGGLVCLFAGVITTANGIERCPGPGDREVTAECTIKAEGVQTAGITVSLGGVGLMIAAVGFQIASIGRSGAPAQVSFPQAPPAAGPPPQPHYPPQR